MVERRLTESNGFRPSGKVDYLANVPPNGDTSVDLVDQPVDEPIKVWASTPGPIPRNG
jgi:hypothetical protein